MEAIRDVLWDWYSNAQTAGSRQNMHIYTHVYIFSEGNEFMADEANTRAWLEGFCPPNKHQHAILSTQRSTRAESTITHCVEYMHAHMCQNAGM